MAAPPTANRHGQSGDGLAHAYMLLDRGTWQPKGSGLGFYKSRPAMEAAMEKADQSWLHGRLITVTEFQEKLQVGGCSGHGLGAADTQATCV